MQIRKISEDKLLERISTLSEKESVEFKSAFDWNDNRKMREEVIKAIMALSNTPKGGVVVIGLREDKKTKKVELDGVSMKQISWFEKNFNRVEADLHKFCSEYPDFEFVWGETDKSPVKKMTPFILIEVQEFQLRPLICVLTGDEKDEKDKKILSEGDLYVRSFSGEWCSKKCSPKEMEEIIKLSVDKSQRDLEVRGYVKIDQVKDLMEKLKKERSDYE